MLSDRCLSSLSVCLSVLSCLLRSCTVAKRWTDKDETWHARRPRPWPHCVRLEPNSPPPKGHNPHPIFGPCLLRPNGCMDQDATWYGARPQPRRLCVRWRPRYTLPKRGRAPYPIFGSFLLWPLKCGQTAACIKIPLGMEVGLSPGDFVLDGNLPLNLWPMFIIVIVISLEHCTMHSR